MIKHAFSSAQCLTRLYSMTAWGIITMTRHFIAMCKADTHHHKNAIGRRCNERSVRDDLLAISLL